MLKTDQLRYFLAVAETGSFAAAGEKLSISPNSLSYAIDNLEHRLQTSLMTRRPAAGITLTPDGRRLLKKARQVLVEIENIEFDFIGRDGDLQGELIIGCQEGLAWSLLPRVLFEVSELHPHLEVKVVPIWMSAFTTPLDDGTADILLTFLADIPKTQGYEIDVLCEPTPCAMMRRGHPLDKDGSPVSLKRLAGYPHIMIDDGAARDITHQLYSDIGMEPNVSEVSNTSTGAQSLVGRSDAVSLRVLRPANALSPLGDPLVYPPIREAKRRPKIVAITKTSKIRTDLRKRNALLHVCKEMFASGVMRQHAHY